YCGPRSGPLARRLQGECSRAARDRAGDDAAARQSGEIQLPGVGSQVRELRAARLPLPQQPLEGSEVGAALELGVQREYLIAPGCTGGESEQMVDRVLAVEILAADELVKRGQRRRQLRHGSRDFIDERQERPCAARVGGIAESELPLQRGDMAIH